MLMQLAVKDIGQLTDIEPSPANRKTITAVGQNRCVSGA
jgi:hypothetical protein